MSDTAWGLIIFGVFAVWIWACTQARDAADRQRGEQATAPEWARWLFVLGLAAVMLAVFGLPLAAILAEN
jgi:hypothetical protein